MDQDTIDINFELIVASMRDEDPTFGAVEDGSHIVYSHAEYESVIDARDSFRSLNKNLLVTALKTPGFRREGFRIREQKEAGWLLTAIAQAVGPVELANELTNFSNASRAEVSRLVASVAENRARRLARQAQRG